MKNVAGVAFLYLNNKNEILLTKKIEKIIIDSKTDEGEKMGWQAYDNGGGYIIFLNTEPKHGMSFCIDNEDKKFVHRSILIIDKKKCSLVGTSEDVNYRYGIFEGDNHVTKLERYSEADIEATNLTDVPDFDLIARRSKDEC